MEVPLLILPSLTKSRPRNSQKDTAILKHRGSLTTSGKFSSLHFLACLRMKDTKWLQKIHQYCRRNKRHAGNCMMFSYTCNIIWDSYSRCLAISCPLAEDFAKSPGFGNPKIWDKQPSVSTFTSP